MAVFPVIPLGFELDQLADIPLDVGLEVVGIGPLRALGLLVDTGKETAVGKVFEIAAINACRGQFINRQGEQVE